MLDKLIAANFQVDFRSHAMAILKIDFPEVAEVIEDVLLGSTIPIEEIIRSGGGETKGTQRLRNALRAREWNKHNFIVERTIDGVPREAQSHEVDHVRTLAAGTIALEIEWNNKDPFFDRDLNNFRLLFDLRAIDVGVIITRATELHGLFDELGKTYVTSTTHHEKLWPRIEGGGGGGCPVLTFAITRKVYVDDGQEALEQSRHDKQALKKRKTRVPLGAGSGEDNGDS